MKFEALIPAAASSNDTAPRLKIPSFKLCQMPSTRWNVEWREGLVTGPTPMMGLGRTTVRCG